MLMPVQLRRIGEMLEFAMVPISKSTFLQFQICPKDTWLRLHKPELVETFTLTEFEKHLFEQGNTVEAYARNLFLDAVLVSATGDDAVDETGRLMAGGADAIFQATFLADGFFTKCDVIKRGAAPGTWDVFEIKGVNKRRRVTPPLPSGSTAWRADRRPDPAPINSGRQYRAGRCAFGRVTSRNVRRPGVPEQRE